MADANETLFLRKYKERIEKTTTWRPVHQWYDIYVKEGELKFLEKLEEQEEFNDFCKKFHKILLDEFDPYNQSMWVHYGQYKDKFKSDVEAFAENFLRMLNAFYESEEYVRQL